MFLRQGNALLKGVERLGSVFVEFGAVAGQLDGSALAFEQGDAKLLFQLRDRIRERRLRDEQLLGRMRIVLNFG